MAQDILIQQKEQGGALDLVIDGADFKGAEGLESTVATLLFSDARAAPEEVNSPEKRRGWVGNVLRSRELGGMLWLASQIRNTQESRNKIQRWAENSLQPLIDDGLASEIIVNVAQDGSRGIKLSVTINIKEGEIENFDLWLVTDLGNLTNAD